MRAQEFVTATGQQILRYVKSIHDDFRLDREILKHHRWRLTEVPLSSLHIPDPESGVDPQDPYDRVQWIDMYHVDDIRASDIQRRPIVVDTDGHILDGNHRALAARLMGMEQIPAWRPVQELGEALHFLRPGELRGSYTDQDLIRMGFRRASNGAWYMDQARWERLVASGRLREQEETDPALPSVKQARRLMPQLLARAQQDYDAWDESDQDTYAGGGICHIIADSICDVLYQAGINCAPVSCSYEQHVYVAAQFDEGVYTIDIPYHVYETGGGFSWKKIPDVRFAPRDMVFYRVSGDPREFDDYIAENFADGRVRGKSRPGRVKRAGASCKGSVTDLRQRAKKYGGERGRMYHWCANMKSGRARKK